MADKKEKLSSEARQAKILQFFRDGSCATAASLGGQFSVSARTIRNDIHALNEEMADSAVIESKNGEYTMRVFDKESFRLVYSSFIETDEQFNSGENRRHYCMGVLMRSAAPVLTDELAYEIHVGRTTLIGDLKKLREELAPYNIYIEGHTSKGLTLEGGEFDIRVYVLENCYDTIYADYPLDDEILRLLETHLKKVGYEKNVRDYCRKYLTLMLDRFLTGHFIGRLPDRYYNLTARKEFSRVDLVANQIADYLHIGIPIEEKIFMMLPAIGMRTPTNFGEAYKIELDEQTTPLLNRIFDEISSRMDINLDREAFARELAYHLMYMVNRIRFGIPLSNPLLNEIKSKYPLAFNMSRIAGEIIEQEVGESVSDDELGHLASYFGVYLEETGINRGKNFSVAVVCGSGRVTARLILVQLRKILDDSVTIDLYSDERANENILNDHDMVLTTIELPYTLNIPVIRIREIFDEKELLNQIEKVRVAGDWIDTTDGGSSLVLESFLDDTRFFRFTVDYYDAALSRMSQKLFEQGLCDAGFYPRLLLREKKGSMIFENGVALPHAIQTASDQVGLCVGTFSNPVESGGREVSIIFLLAVPEAVLENDLLLKLYDEIINIASNKQMLDSMVKANDYRHFLLALNG